MIASDAIPAPFQPVRAKLACAERAAGSRTESLHDAGLVCRFNAGDETAFVEIVARYRERMLAVGFGVLKNGADAEEIAQDTFIRAHRALGQFRGDASLATWLHRIALNLARNRYWYFFRRRRQATLSLDCPFGADNHSTFSDLAASGAPDPARAAANGEFSQLVDACLERLGSQPREILHLRNALDLSYGEIAGRLGLNIGTVKSRLARARERLRVLLAEACPEFGVGAQPMAWFESLRPAGGVTMLCA